MLRTNNNDILFDDLAVIRLEQDTVQPGTYNDCTNAINDCTNASVLKTAVNLSNDCDRSNCVEIWGDCND